MGYTIEQRDESRSFPLGDPFLAGADSDSDVTIYIGTPAKADATRAAILIELGSECLRQHLDVTAGTNILGFARYRNGTDTPSKLIELVHLPETTEHAIAAARAVFETAGFIVVVCSDQPGRILDRLLRPKYNAALRFLDEGLATAADMDTTCRLGLGYPDGPIERVMRGSLAYHYEVTQSLFENYGTPGYSPAPAALAAARRKTP